MYELGYRFDLGPVIAPVDLSAAAVTGKRVMARNAQNVNFVVFKGAEAGTDDPVLTFQQFTASSAGTTAALLIDHYWVKSANTLAGTETWTRVNNTSDGNPYTPGVNTINATLTLTGLAGKQAIVVVEVNTKDLTDTFDYCSVNAAKAGTTAQLGGILTILGDLVTKRSPGNLQPTLF